MKYKILDDLMPPENGCHTDLFDHFWSRGVGADLDEKGIRLPWTSKALQEAMNFAVSDRAIQSWSSGASVPSEKNIRQICNVISAFDKQLGTMWLRAWLPARSFEDRKRREEKRQQKHIRIGAHAIFREGISSVDVAISNSNLGNDDEGLGVEKSNATFRFGLPIVVIMTLIFGYGSFSHFLYQGIQYSISDIRFCLYENFSDHTKTCSVSETHFPSDTKKIYVSFKDNGIPENTMFQRKWYTNGENWFDKTDFFDEAWENYTWIHNRNGHENGEYVLRIIVGGQVFLGRFTVGEL